MSTRTAVRTPSDRSVSGWYSILPEPGPARELADDITADWVIVGAGFAGLAAAHRLANRCPGERIVLLDAQRVGWGAAGRNSGFMIDLPHELNSDNYTSGADEDRRKIARNRAGIAAMKEAVDAYGLHEHFNPCGKLHGATDGNGLRALGEFENHLDALDEPYTHLSAADMKHITGSDYYAGGMHAPGAVIIQPAALVRGITDGLANRVHIYENSPAIEITPGDAPVVRTRRGSVTAGKLILTVNGHLESFGYAAKRLVHVFLYASMTRELTSAEQRTLGGRDEWALIPADPMGTTVRRLREGRIVVRNSATYNPAMSVGEDDIARAGGANDASFRARFPMLGNVEMAYRWAGHLCLSLNSVPVFGEIERGIISACCQNGLGTVAGTLHGRLAADLALGSNDPVIAELLADEPPRRLYPEPFMSLGVKASLWWYRRRAGRDF
ncbi:MAG: FAD-binding oxidoreductase [Rhodospirillales bacterium]